MVEIDLRMGCAMDSGHPVHGCQPILQCIQHRCLDQIHLVQQHHIGKGDLLLYLSALVQMKTHMMGIHNGDDRIQSYPLGEKIIHEERLSHRTRIGKTCRLDKNDIEAVPSFHQVAENADQIASNRAANAAVVHLEYFFVRIDDQRLIYANLAELIFDDGYSLAMLLAEYAVKESGFARAQKASQHGYWYAVVLLFLHERASSLADACRSRRA